MARKTMPATRKRRLAVDHQQHEQHSVQMDITLHDHNAPQGHQRSPLPCFLFMTPSSPSECPAHPDSKKTGARRHTLDDPHAIKRRLITGKKRKRQMPLFDNFDLVSEVLTEMSKSSNSLGRFQNENPLIAGYGLDHSSLSCTGKSFSNSDVANAFSTLRAWLNDKCHNLTVKQYISHFMKWTKLKSKLQRHAWDGGIARNLLESYVHTCLQGTEPLLCQEKVNGVQDVTLTTLVDTLMTLQQVFPGGKRKQACSEDLSTTTAWTFPKGDCGQIYGKNSRKRDNTGLEHKLCIQSESPIKNSCMIEHCMSHNELESWIVRHSVPSKKNCWEELLGSVDNDGKGKKENKIDGHSLSTNCEEHKRTFKLSGNQNKTEGSRKASKNSEIKIEVNLRGQSDSLLQRNVARLAATTTPKVTYLTHIVTAVSLKTAVYSNGDSEAMVLFKALRSDGREVMVDNNYLRSMYPILLLNFYEQNLCFENSTSGSEETEDK